MNLDSFAWNAFRPTNKDVQNDLLESPMILIYFYITALRITIKILCVCEGMGRFQNGSFLKLSNQPHTLMKQKYLRTRMFQTCMKVNLFWKGPVYR